jgi:hypothetical protein
MKSLSKWPLGKGVEVLSEDICPLQKFLNALPSVQGNSRATDWIAMDWDAMNGLPSKYDTKIK